MCQVFGYLYVHTFKNHKLNSTKKANLRVMIWHVVGFALPGMWGKPRCLWVSGYNRLQLVLSVYSWRLMRSSHKAPGNDTVFGNGDIICLAGASLDRSSFHNSSATLRSSPRVRDFSSAAADLARKMSSLLMILVAAQKRQRRDQ